MAVRGDCGPRALWRGYGLQRVSRDGAKRERQSVLLRDQAGRLGCDRIRRNAAGDAVQLSTTEEPSPRLRAIAAQYDWSDCGVWIQQHQRRASLDQATGFLATAVGGRE